MCFGAARGAVAGDETPQPQEQRARHAQGTQGMPCEATLLPTFTIPALLYHMPSAPICTAAEKNCNALERAALYLQRAAGVLEAVEGAQRVTLSEAVGGQVRRLRLFAYAREQLVLFAMKGSGRGVRGSRGAASTFAVPAGRAGFVGGA